MQQELFPIEPNKGKALKSYMQDHFPFAAFKKIGFFKGLKFNDYEAQAKRVCTFFGYENVYEYSKHEIRVHISYTDCPLGIGSLERPMWVDEKGKLQTIPFVETIFPNQMHI